MTKQTKKTELINDDNDDLNTDEENISSETISEIRQKRIKKNTNKRGKTITKTETTPMREAHRMMKETMMIQNAQLKKDERFHNQF